MSDLNFTLFDGYQVGSSNSFTSVWVDVRFCNSYSISTTFSVDATVDGYLSLQCSNESDIGSPMGGLQNTSPGTAIFGAQPKYNGLDAVTVTNGILNAIQHITDIGTTTFDVAWPAYRWVRLVFTGTSGTPLITSWFNGKN